MPSIYRSVAGQELVRNWSIAQLDRWLVPHERLTVEARGAETHVVSAGSGGSTVVYVPGTNFNAAVSAPLADALIAAGQRVLLVDVPGQPGLSTGDRIAASDRAAWYGAWLDDLIEQLDTGSITLIGHSLGAAIALSATSPRIDRRILVSPGGLIRLSLTPAVVAASTPWFLRPTPERSARLLKTMVAPGHEPRPELVGWMTLVAEHTRSSGDPGRVRQSVARSNDVVVSGEYDVFLPPRRLGPAARATLGLDLHVISAAGHLVVDEQPDRVAALACG